MCLLQDRNIFYGESALCPHCRAQPKTVDHLASRCEKMLHFDYVRRHNEIVRVLHSYMCSKYGLKRSKRLKGHVVEPVVSNEYVEIRFDVRVQTDTKIAANRPDLQIYDKKAGEIIFIEVGVTSQDQLQTVETEKLRKYDTLASEVSMIHRCPVKIIPYVLQCFSKL